jgi:hypothetical protein
MLSINVFSKFKIQRLLFLVAFSKRSVASVMSKSSVTKPPAVQFDADVINQIVEEEIQLRRYGNVSEKHGKAAKASEVFSVWEQDSASVAFIDSSLEHTNELTHQMVWTSFAFKASNSNSFFPKKKKN